jgi:hypothetical protein
MEVHCFLASLVALRGRLAHLHADGNVRASGARVVAARLPTDGCKGYRWTSMENQFGKLKALTVRGYKSIRSIERLALHDLNIVIGPNGAGKSNFVSLFQFLARIARDEVDDIVIKQGGLEKVLYFGPRMTE